MHVLITFVLSINMVFAKVVLVILSWKASDLGSFFFLHNLGFDVLNNLFYKPSRQAMVSCETPSCNQV